MHLLATDASAGAGPGSRGAVVLGLFRILVGLSFVAHGLSKLFAWPVAPHGGHVATVGSWPSWWAAVIEIGGGGLVALGIGTRIAALLCSGAMAYAFLLVHVKQSAILPIQNGGETAVLFCWSFFLIAMIGPGAFAGDTLLLRRTGRSMRRATPADVRG
ncbi:DoxX family protein [Nocardia ninae]|uniref:Integral membrane protein n=1 Tax=Nocardia ninae NBRC 108245 TaxID=1210091 RepID=A0A511MCL0_9NOCA|nr:DoxX family protein [Nocardia ninae]GEM38329.1 integral membrane protein [Nocardia ninae NBRC 108245]